MSQLTVRSCSCSQSNDATSHLCVCSLVAESESPYLAAPVDELAHSFGCSSATARVERSWRLHRETLRGCRERPDWCWSQRPQLSRSEEPSEVRLLIHDQPGV